MDADVMEGLVRQFMGGEIVRVAVRNYSETSPIKTHMEQAFRAGYYEGIGAGNRQIVEVRGALYRIGVEVDTALSRREVRP